MESQGDWRVRGLEILRFRERWGVRETENSSKTEDSWRFKSQHVSKAHYQPHQTILINTLFLAYFEQR
jgi:hypothetical protein